MKPTEVLLIDCDGYNSIALAFARQFAETCDMTKHVQHSKCKIYSFGDTPKFGIYASHDLKRVVVRRWV